MNILVLTSNYKSDDLPDDLTPVVHYFTKEWVKEGVKVIVVHNQTYFPAFVYFFLKLFKKILSNKVGYSFAIKKNCEIDYEIDRVKVYRRNILKLIPHQKFSKKSYEKQQLKIQHILNENKFVPDVIVGHWITPQLKLLYDLKQIYNCPNCLVVHEALPLLERDYSNEWKKYLYDIDIVGYRSKVIKELFIDRYNMDNFPYFICPSGIPDEFVPQEFYKNFDKIKTYSFVGNLIKRKHPETILLALKSITSKYWHINYVGEGYLKSKLEKLSIELNLGNRVNLIGRLNREKVIDILKHTDVFIMVSEEETFGLVYLEAMANGCITIASRNEGFDGIIIDGFNGFLCNAGDVNELNVILKKIDSLSKNELMKISYEGYMTAKKFTDKNVAKNYLDNLLKL